MQPRLLSVFLCATAALLLAACSSKPISVDEFNTLVVTLPDGFEVRSEIMTHPEDMVRGMMFRDSLAEDRGMIFLHGEPGKYTYWMYQVKVPLDIIWMDTKGRIVEISANTPPCETNASECPKFGGNEGAAIVLELKAGSAAKHNLRVGMRLRF
jgi:uncharacterized membrane protein (UPF0127 family)